MNLLATPIVSIAVALALIVWNIYNSITKKRQGTIGEAADTINILQADITLKAKTISDLKAEQIKVLSDLKEANNKEVSRLREENAGLNATLVEKDHQIQSYIGVFQGRNPDMVEFMKNMTEAVKGFQEYIKGNNERMEKVLETLTVLLGRK